MLLLLLFLSVDRTKRDQAAAGLALTTRGSETQGLERARVERNSQQWKLWDEGQGVFV